MSEEISRLPISDAAAGISEAYRQRRENVRNYNTMTFGSGDGTPGINYIKLYEAGDEPQSNGEHYDEVTIDTSGQATDGFYTIDSGIKKVLTETGKTSLTTDESGSGVGIGYAWRDYDVDYVNGATALIQRYDKEDGSRLVYEHTSHNPEFVKRLAEVAAKKVANSLNAARDEKGDITNAAESAKSK